MKLVDTKQLFETSICKANMHDFIRIDTFTGGIKYRCIKCGLEAIESNLSGDMQISYLGSYIENTSLLWKSEDMCIDEIESFTISFGELPICVISYQKGKLTLQNRINGSRDGWMTFPKGYFDKKYFSLTKSQEEKIFTALKDIDFSLWKVDAKTFENLYACGFCLYDYFKCSFTNGKHYNSYSPGIGFEKIEKILCEICNITPYWRKGVNEDDF